MNGDNNLPNFVKPRKTACPTRYVFISNADTTSDTVIQDITDIFQSFGELDTSTGPVFVNYKRHVCYVCYKDPMAAQHAIQQSIDPGVIVKGRKISAKYADIARPVTPPPEAECTSTTDHVDVPGLYLIEEVISSEEEASLIALCDSNEKGRTLWRNNISRRVQHFGYEFNYQTLLLDKPRDIRPVPEDIVAVLVERVPPHVPLDGSRVTQCTVNEYYPGQGIASHVDTESCFGETIHILSLGGGVVMTMARVEPQENVPSSHPDNETVPPSHLRRSFAPTKPTDTEESGEVVKKHVYLPPRSLLVLSDEARFHWAHSIAPRKFDKVNGELIKRSRRLSFTFREAIGPRPSTPEVEKAPTTDGPSNSEDVARRRLNEFKSGEDVKDGILSSNIEQEHVYKVYDEIAQHWHHTRGIRKVYWHRVKSFLDDLPQGSLVADVGCGDGKYFGVNPNIITIGCDRSPVLLQVSRETQNDTFCCDAVKLPFISDAFDASICIAVLHHLASEDRRVAVIAEMIRIMKPGGRAMLQAWAMEQEAGSKRVFEEQNVLVPWRLQSKFSRTTDKDDTGPVVFQRFCHVYCEGELEHLASKVEGCRVIESGYDRSNWYIVFEKECI